MTIKYIYFHNNTDLPLNISSWIDGSNILNTTKINPRENLVIHSSVGEWHLDALLFGDDRKVWIEKGFDYVHLIGKFRSKPCYFGDYSWLDHSDIFDCIYSKIENSNNENKITGLITFSLK